MRAGALLRNRTAPRAGRLAGGGGISGVFWGILGYFGVFWGREKRRRLREVPEPPGQGWESQRESCTNSSPKECKALMIFSPAAFLGVETPLA